MAPTTLGTRMFLAHSNLEQTLRRKVSHRELGRLVADREHRKDARGRIQPYSSGNVSRWVNGKKTPDIETLKAFADVCGVRRAWLVLNEGDMEDVASLSQLSGEITPVRASKKAVRKKSAGR